MDSEHFVLRGPQISQTISKDETRNATLREEQILKLALGTDCSQAYTTHRHQSAEAERERKQDEWEEFVRTRKWGERKAKRKEREEEEAFEEEMRKRLRALGYTEQTIDAMVDKEKTKKFKTKGDSSHTKIRDDGTDVSRAPRAPVYPKVHKSYLATETLKYYDIPWEYDRSDPDYIIILRDMDKREVDLLFEHTTRLRSGRLIVEH